VQKKENKKKLSISKNQIQAYTIGSFGYDLDFLKQKDSGLIVLTNEDDNRQNMVSPKYYAKVFTTTANGMEGNRIGRRELHSICKKANGP